jgi:AraC-like DNA-binding protein
MNLSLADIFLIIIVFQFLFICFFLFSHRAGNRRGKLLLAFFFLTIAINLLDSFLLMRQVYRINTAWVGWGICMPLLYGPLLFLYTQSVLYRDFSLSLDKWFHFLPFILLFAGFEISYFSTSRAFRVHELDRIVLGQIPVAFYWSSALIYLQYFIYIAFCFRLLRRYHQVATNQFSDNQRTNLYWLRSTLVFFSACMILAASGAFARPGPLGRYYGVFLVVVLVFLFVFINRVLLKALQHPEIFGILEKENEDQLAVAADDSGDPARENLLELVRGHMLKEKPYLDPDLSLEQLATRLAMRPRILSQLINESLHQNFFDFVNRYRIEEAKRLLTRPPDKKITVLEVLYEVGFNSKSSFNTLFKKYTGLTPSEFRKKQE